MGSNHLSVFATVADSGSEHIGVMLEQSASCGGCSSRATCGAGKPPGRVELSVNAPYTRHVEPGRRLEVSVQAGSLGKMAVLAYLVPALALFLGAALAATIFPDTGDLGALLGAILGLLVGCWLLRLYDARCGHAGWKMHHLGSRTDPQVCFNKF